MKCCSNCFIDPLLRSEWSNIADARASCDYCASHNVEVVDPQTLKDKFSPVVALYSVSAKGKPLVDCLQEDWKIFDVDRLGPQGARSLLADILDDAELVRKPFSISQDYVRPGMQMLWGNLRNELITRNRYFPETELDKERFGELLDFLRGKNVPTRWYRARVQQGADPYTIAQMGAPPKEVTSYGRANPPGIPYLYLAEYRDTAAAEVRPHTGERVCVAEFEVPADLRVVDLREPRRLISPFVLGDEDLIASLRSDIPFVERLGEELTRPVMPNRAAIDYVPSQYLCELIKRKSWQGVLYRSSVGEGMNMALFDPLQAQGLEVRQLTVSKVSVEIV